MKKTIKKALMVTLILSLSANSAFGIWPFTRKQPVPKGFFQKGLYYAKKGVKLVKNATKLVKIAMLTAGLATVGAVVAKQFSKKDKTPKQDKKNQTTSQKTSKVEKKEGSRNIFSAFWSWVKSLVSSKKQEVKKEESQKPNQTKPNKTEKKPGQKVTPKEDKTNIPENKKQQPTVTSTVTNNKPVQSVVVKKNVKPFKNKKIIKKSCKNGKCKNGRCPVKSKCKNGRCPVKPNGNSKSCKNCKNCSSRFVQKRLRKRSRRSGHCKKCRHRKSNCKCRK